MKIHVKCQGLLIISLLAFSLFASFQLSSGVEQKDFHSATDGLNTNVSVDSDLTIIESMISSSDLLELKSLIGVYEEGRAYPIVIDGHGTGLIPPTEEEWLKIAQSTPLVHKLAISQDLPSSVDLSLTPWFPPIGDQGKQGSCASWAVGYYTKTFQEAKEHSWNFSEAKWNETEPSIAYQDKIISPSFIYNLINNGVDDGSLFEDPITLICSVGAATWKTMPYSDKNCTAWPSEAAWNEAPLYRGDSSGYKFVSLDSNEGLTNLKMLLASGNLAITAVDAYKYRNFTDNDVLVVDKYVDIELNHAATIVGYDDNITYIENGQQCQGAFKIANSWGVGQTNSDGEHWENIIDGYYWISYEAMKQQVGWCIYFDDIIGYQPSLLAEFQIEHEMRNEVSITVGVGTPTVPLATKIFSESKTFSDTYFGSVFGGNHSFPSNKIILDITELAEYVTGPYYQSFFLKVHDSGTPAIGNVTFFAIQDSISKVAPVETEQYENVYLTVTHSLALPTLTVSSPLENTVNLVTLNGVGFTPDGSVSLSYLNPITNSWVPITEGLYLESTYNFTYSFIVPDLIQSNPAGDNAPEFDEIIFKAQDNTSGYICNSTNTYTQWRRGLTQVGNAHAEGLYGNSTDLTLNVIVQKDQPLIIAGQQFMPGSATILLDDLYLLTVIIGDAGSFNTTVTIPAINSGNHSLIIQNAGYNFYVTISGLPQILHDRIASWHTSNFTVNLSPEMDGTEIFYRINNGSINTVKINGQPKITSESSNNTLEYWGTWNIYGTGTIDLPKNFLTGIKLDKTAPIGSITTNTPQTNITTVQLALFATDNISGVAQMRFSNDRITWSEWEPYNTSKTWLIPNGDGQKIITVQFKNNAKLISAYNCAITLETSPRPTITPSSSPTTTPTATTTATISPSSDPTTLVTTSPTALMNTNDFSLQFAFVLIAILTVVLVVLYKSLGRSA